MSRNRNPAILVISVNAVLISCSREWFSRALNPARISGIDKGTLGVSSDADIIVVAPDKEWLVRKEEIVSKSKNSPFLGRKLKGVVEYTICLGKVVYSKGK